MMTELVAEFRRDTALFEAQVAEIVRPASRNGKDPADREVVYQEALRLAERIDEDLRRGVRHYRTRAGLLLNTLDEVVRAILEDELEVASWAN